MQRSPIHIFVVVFDFQVCEIFVINEGKLLKELLKSRPYKGQNMKKRASNVIKVLAHHLISQNGICM